VLPLRLGSRFAPRVDLKPDRADGVLRVLSAHADAGAEREAAAGPLAAELRLMATWLGLKGVVVANSGDLARQLKRALGRA
jgi:uncharacterized protein YcaQ